VSPRNAKSVSNKPPSFFESGNDQEENGAVTVDARPAQSHGIKPSGVGVGRERGADIKKTDHLFGWSAVVVIFVRGTLRLRL